jgi:putative ABC transport system ATP-binding protein
MPLFIRRTKVLLVKERSTISPASQTETAVRLDSVSKIYGKGDSAVTALNNVSVELPRGSFTAVMGPSGSGKSTFMHLAAGLDRTTSGTVWLGDIEFSTMKEPKLTTVRRERVGFVFQAFNLVPSLTARDNILLPLRLAGRRADMEWVRAIVARVGLTDRVKHRPAELSGGQQQRVAIARALVIRPEVIFADEPTGALDSKTGKEILTLLRDVVDGLGQTVVMVTHDPRAASYADRVLFLADGSVVDELYSPTVERVAERMTRLEA